MLSSGGRWREGREEAEADIPFEMSEPRLKSALSCFEVSRQTSSWSPEGKARAVTCSGRKREPLGAGAPDSP